jgi:hypothetical protein
VTAVTSEREVRVLRLKYGWDRSKEHSGRFPREGADDDPTREPEAGVEPRGVRTTGNGWQGGRLVARALRNHNVWLTLTYVGLILLMARTYA